MLKWITLVKPMFLAIKGTIWLFTAGRVNLFRKKVVARSPQRGVAFPS